MDGEEITVEHNFPLSKPTRPKPPKPSQSPNPTPPPPTADLEIERPGQNANEEEDSTAAFADLGLANWIVKTCTELSIRKPTVVQSRCIPKILEGKDVLGIAQIGSSKTVAFALGFGLVIECSMLDGCQGYGYAYVARGHRHAKASTSTTIIP